MAPATRAATTPLPDSTPLRLRALYNFSVYINIDRKASGLAKSNALAARSFVSSPDLACWSLSQPAHSSTQVSRRFILHDCLRVILLPTGPRTACVARLLHHGHEFCHFQSRLQLSGSWSVARDSDLYPVAILIFPGTSRGFRIYHTDPFAKIFSSDDGNVAIIEMLFSTSLVALILSPRHLIIQNTKA